MDMHLFFGKNMTETCQSNFKEKLFSEMCADYV